MPKSAPYLLIWSEDRGTYEVRHQDGRSPHPLHAEDQRDFIRFVDSASFAFQGKHGRLTLRKESRPHGEGYWYAYRSQGRRTLKKYAGRTADLTIARLEDIAEALTAEACSSTDERPQVKGRGIPSLERLAPAEAVGAMHNVHVPSPVPTFPAGQFAPLFAPKLHLPRLHASLLARERLLSRLDAGLEGKLTLLSAPAGFGKTTLVSQWVADVAPTIAVITIFQSWPGSHLILKTMIRSVSGPTSLPHARHSSKVSANRRSHCSTQSHGLLSSRLLWKQRSGRS